MSFSAAIRALGETVRAPETQWGDPDAPRVELCPRLRSTYSPRASWGFGAPEGRDGKPSMPEWARVWDYGPPAAGLGLSLAPNPKRPARHGLSGMPPAARKAVWRALVLLEERRELLSFWTVSLPTEGLIEMGRQDSWWRFQDRVRKEIVRRLRAAGLPVLVVGVVELQPKRSLATGIPCPHLHVVFQGRKSRGSRWALSPADLDGVILAALSTAGVRVPDGIDAAVWVRSAGNVQQVHRSVRAYLSKYLTKGGNDTARFVGGEWEGLLPRQWRFWSEEMRRLVELHVIPMAFAFVGWIHAFRADLQEMGLIRLKVLDLPDPRAPMTFEVNWIDLGAFARVVSIWQDWLWMTEWEQRYRLTYGRLDPREHSELYQHV